MSVLEKARRAKLLRIHPKSAGGEDGLRTNEKYEQIIPAADPDSIEIPAADWRWTVANWPHDRWVAWRRRVDEILAAVDGAIPPEDVAEAPRADADEIREAGRLAFEEMTRPSLFAGRSGEGQIAVTAIG